MIRVGCWRPVFRRFFPIALVCVVTACDGDPVGPIGLVIPTPEGILDAPSQLTFSGHSYELQAYLWRDFQPSSSPDGNPLLARVLLVETDSLAIPGDVTMDFLWVVNGERTWATQFSNEERPLQPDHRLNEIARDGPNWGPGIAVDVVVRVRAGSDDVYQIIATDQMIVRTD